MCFVLSWVGALLPVPRHLPIERFFETARQATITSIFAVTLAPLMEELFFRGLLYPTLARWLGQLTGVLTPPSVARQGDRSRMRNLPGAVNLGFFWGGSCGICCLAVVKRASQNQKSLLAILSS